MPLYQTESPVPVVSNRMHSSTAGSFNSSNEFRWSASQRLWSSVDELWLRRELIVFWTFMIVLSIVTYFTVHLLFQMQTNVASQARSTTKLTDQIAAVSTAQSEQGASISQLQQSYKQVIGVVSDLNHKFADIHATDHEVSVSLKSLTARVAHIERQRQESIGIPPVSQASPGAAATQAAGPGHIHQFVNDINPPKTVEVRQVGGDETVWIVSKNGTPMVVRPFATSSLGIWVHSATDSRDYILTPSGGWMAGSTPQ